MFFMVSPIVLEEIILRAVLLPLIRAEPDGITGHGFDIFFP